MASATNTIRLHQVLRAPPDRVYRAFLDPDAMVKWLPPYTLDQTMRVLANADLVLTNDSGPFHLTLATQAPLVALFGPTRSETYLPPGRPKAIGVYEPILLFSLCASLGAAAVRWGQPVHEAVERE
jgi:ADP-heptose:LPS heptosyltransferase